MKNITRKQIEAMEFGEKSRLAHKMAGNMKDDYSARLKMSWNHIMDRDFDGKKVDSIKAINMTLNKQTMKQAKKAEKKAEKEKEKTEKMTGEQAGQLAEILASELFNETEQQNIGQIVERETNRRQCEIKTVTPEQLIEDLQASETRFDFATHILMYAGKYAFWTASKYHDIGTNHDAQLSIEESHKQENASQFEKITGLGLEKHLVSDTAQTALSDIIRLEETPDHVHENRKNTKNKIQDAFDHETTAKFYGIIKSRVQNAIATEQNRKRQLAKNGNSFTSLDNEKSQNILEKMAQGKSNKETDYMTEIIQIMDDAGITLQTAKIALMKLDNMNHADISKNLGVKDAKRQIEKARKELVEKLGWGKELLEGKRKKA